MLLEVGLPVRQLLIAMLVVVVVIVAINKQLGLVETGASHAAHHHQLSSSTVAMCAPSVKFQQRPDLPIVRKPASRTLSRSLLQAL